MEVVGSEIGQKMRSAIKAKLTELGCYVDDELPDYVMVMVANKRTRAQMEEDLQLFLGDNTQLFVNWLHQVLKKLQEVTVTPLKAAEFEKPKEKPKEKKLKTKKVKDKIKKTDSKKAKKKDKEKSHRKEKKTHKSKKKSKKHEMIRPNIPPLLMNMEKESEPSITDVFAGQILKNHGITLDIPVLPVQKEETADMKPVIKEKRPILPIIDPATIMSQPEEQLPVESQTNVIDVDKTQQNDPVETISVETEAPRDEQIKEIDKIEAKIQGLKQKLAEQLDSMSEDEDFLNIRTEAEELMNDFAEDVFQEISSQAPANPVDPSPPPKPIETPAETPKDISSTSKAVPIDTAKELPETIELNLPKRPVRERLGAREEAVKLLEKTKLPEKKSSPERFTPEPESDFWGKSKPSARSRLGSLADRKRSSFSSDSDESEKEKEKGRKRITSSSTEHTRSERAERGPRAKCASVVVVKPRMRAQTSSLLLRAVADAHKSLLNIPPPKADVETPKVKRALVRPMRRTDEKIQVHGSKQRDRHTDSAGDDSDHNKTARLTSETDKTAEYVPLPLSLRFSSNADYVPSQRKRLSPQGETPDIDDINIHETSVDTDKNTQFIVTMDGFDPNAFLAKKLKKEGLLNDGNDSSDKPKTSSVLKIRYMDTTKDGELTKEAEIEEKNENLSEARNTDANEAVTKNSESNKNKDKTEESELNKNTETYQETTKKSESSYSKDALENLESNKNKATTQEKIENETRIENEGRNKQNKSKGTSPQMTGNETRIEVERKTKTKEVKKDKEHDKNITSCSSSVQNKRLSYTSDTQVIIKQEKVFDESEEMRKTDVEMLEPPLEKKRKASPIVFDMGIKEREIKRERERDREREKEEERKAEEKEKERERKRARTESANSDSHVVVTTAVNTNKYDTIPPLSTTERKTVWCRAFPACRYGAACVFLHPRCKFAAACTRRSCVYSHDVAPRLPAVPAPIVASHVVPVANYKTITPGVLPSICRFYPNCISPACRFFHPKPCHFGAGCANKLECNFYHGDGK